MIDFITDFIVMAGIMLTSFYIFKRSVHYSPFIWQAAAAVGWSLLWAGLFAVAPFLHLPVLIIRPLACFLSIFFAFLMSDQIFETVVTAYLLSFGISYCLYSISSFLVGLAFMPFVAGGHIPGTPINYERPVYLLIFSLAVVAQFAAAFGIFRIRRFKKGFRFIFNKNIVVLALIFTGAVLIFVTLMRVFTSAGNTYPIIYLFVGITTVGIGVYIWVRRLIRGVQVKRAQQNSADYYEKLWLEEKNKCVRLTEQNKEMYTVIHNFITRIDAMEAALERRGEEAGDVLALKGELREAMTGIKGKKPLPATKIRAIDDLFDHFARLFAEDKIEFNLMVNGSIVFMVYNVIKQGALEILIANHLKDAQIAVNAGGGPFRAVMAVIGITDEFYEFTVLDSGVPFEADTLARLGTGRVTTYADSGGSGIGFETTFETMRETGASLIISEQEPSDSDYTKSVSIRFDGKTQYIIKTHRPEAFPQSERYVVLGR